MRYLIADEIVIFEKEGKSINDRFDLYKYNEDNYFDYDICLEYDGFEQFCKEHNNLCEEQCELIYTLQIFFRNMLNKNKLLIHASVIVINGLSVMFIGNAGCGKSYFLEKLKLYCSESYIFSDDRTVIGLENQKLLAWNTPWSKFGISSPKGIFIDYIFFISVDNVFDISEISSERLIQNMVYLYPKVFRNQIGSLLYKMIKKKKCFEIKNDMHSFDIQKLRCVGIDL